MVYEQYRRKIKRLRCHVFSHHALWRKRAELLGLSRAARQRLEWIIYYHATAEQNARLTCRHFGIPPKTFYKWFDRFDETHLGIMEDESRAPKHTRQKEFTSQQYLRVIELRKQYIRYGKMKLLKLYQNRYPDDRAITSWKIQCIIEKAKLYYHPQKQARINRKRVLSQKRKKITELKTKKIKGFLLCMDSVVLYWMGQKRYIITAIDKWTKVAFARMYTTAPTTQGISCTGSITFLMERLKTSKPTMVLNLKNTLTKGLKN